MKCTMNCNVTQWIQPLSNTSFEFLTSPQDHKEHSKNTPAQSGLNQVFKVCSHFSLKSRLDVKEASQGHTQGTQDCSRVWQRQLQTASCSQSSVTHPVIRKCGQGTGLGITQWHPQLHCWLSLGDSQITWLMIYFCHNTYLGFIQSAALVQEPISLFSAFSRDQVYQGIHPEQFSKS